jgi:hypothetical protein
MTVGVSRFVSQNHPWKTYAYFGDIVFLAYVLKDVQELMI